MPWSYNHPGMSSCSLCVRCASLFLSPRGLFARTLTGALVFDALACRRARLELRLDLLLAVFLSSVTTVTTITQRRTGRLNLTEGPTAACPGLQRPSYTRRRSLRGAKQPTGSVAVAGRDVSSEPVIGRASKVMRPHQGKTSGVRVFILGVLREKVYQLISLSP